MIFSSEIQIANFELFSNVPRQFRVYASERYLASPNSNSWPNKYLLGTYEAANSRTIQSFFIKDGTVLNKQESGDASSAASENGESSNTEPKPTTTTSVIMYAKYLKFEMLSHYGQEHFCPLSLVRIFGTSIVDEDDAASADVVGEHSEDTIPVSQNDVIDSSAPVPTTTATTTTTSTSASVTTTPRSPQATTGDNSNQKKPKLLFELTSMFLNNIISTFLRENFNLKSLFGRSDVKEDAAVSTTAPTTKASVPLAADSDQMLMYTRNEILQIDLHKLLCFSSNQKLLLECCQCASKSVNKKKQSPGSSVNYYGSATSNTWLSKYCNYYFLMITTAQARTNSSLLAKYLANMKSQGNMPQSQNTDKNFTQVLINNVNYFILNEWLDNQTHHSNFSASADAIKKADADSNTDKLDTSTDESIQAGLIKTPTESENVIDKSLSETTLNNQSNSTKTDSLKSDNFQVLPDKSDNKSQNKEVEAAKSDKKATVPASSTTTSTASSSTSSSEGSTTQPNENIKSSSSDYKSETYPTSTSTSTTSNTDSGLGTSTTAHTVTAATTTETSSTTTSTSGDTATSTVSATTSTSNVDPSATNVSQQRVQQSTTASSTATVTTTMHHQAPSVPTPIVIANGKDAAFMRLNNRIKILELNMSLSSQYLEKLSQHYRFVVQFYLLNHSISFSFFNFCYQKANG